MKKIFSVFFALMIIIFTLLSCSGGGDKSALTINNTTEIGSEIFTYFFNEAYYSGTGGNETECISIATSKCIEYVSVNTRFAQMNMSFSQNDKADMTLEVNSLWRMYGKYLTEIGISKDTFFKIKQYEYAKEDLRFALYDTDGTQPINENYIKQYFTSNYVGIKYFYEDIYTPVSDTEYAAMSDKDKASYDARKQTASKRYDSISAIANYVNSNVYSMDEAFMAVTGEVSADISVSATVLGKGDASFSDQFIDAVFKQAVGSAFIITNAEHSYIYFIERVDLLSDEYSFYDEYRDRCLVSVSETYFINEVNSWVNSISAVRHLSVVNDCISKVESVERSAYVGTPQYNFKSIEIK